MKLLHLLGFDKTDSGWVASFGNHAVLYAEDDKEWSILDYSGDNQSNPAEHVFKTFEEVMAFLEPRLDVSIVQ